MFHKPFRVKSQTSIKGSDRKKLRTEIGKNYPRLAADELKEIIPNKEEMTVHKIETHSGDHVLVYFLQKNPIFYEIFKTIYPTVYTMWSYPDLLPVFVTWPPVFRKLLGGADLMLPGVVVKGDVNPTALGNLQKGDLCAVRLVGNGAPVAIGRTAQSSKDMYLSAMRGKGVILEHAYTDQLWALGEKSHPPQLDDPLAAEILEANNGKEGDDINNSNEGDETNDSIVNSAKESEESIEESKEGVASTENLAIATEEGAADVAAASEALENTHLVTDSEVGGEGVQEREGEEPVADTGGATGPQEGASVAEEEEEASDDAEDDRSPAEIMDELLLSCFYTALKTKIKKSDLPLLTSKLFKSYLQPCCPPGKNLDIKKSSYKKLGKFLNAMHTQGFVMVKELSKGVESIIEINKSHPELRGFEVTDVPEVPVVEESVSSDEVFCAPVITEVYGVVAVVLPIFKTARFKKGDPATAQEVKKVMMDYIRANNLQDQQNKRLVVLDPTLHDIVCNKGEYKESLTFEDMFSRLLKKMSDMFRISIEGGEPITKKGKLEPISINVLQRAGNKKVTTVENLEVYGIRAQQFAHMVQKGVACSASVTQNPAKGKGLQVLVQGNQINFIADLLQGKYQIPRKYLQGLEKAPKSGKKKR